MARICFILFGIFFFFIREGQPSSLLGLYKGLKSHYQRQLYALYIELVLTSRVYSGSPLWSVFSFFKMIMKSFSNPLVSLPSMDPTSKMVMKSYPVVFRRFLMAGCLGWPQSAFSPNKGSYYGPLLREIPILWISKMSSFPLFCPNIPRCLLFFFLDMCNHP